LLDALVRPRLGSHGQAAVPVVRAVDPAYVEVRGERLDLTEEVDRLEPALAELVRQRVRGRGQLDPGGDQLTQQPGDQHRVTGIVQLELVDADQPVRRKCLDGGAETEGADQVGELDERAVHLRSGGLVPQRREQVRLADPEPAIQIDARLARRRGPTSAKTRPQAWYLARSLQLQTSLSEHTQGFGLRGLVRIRPVRREPDIGEPRRRHTLGQQPVRAHLRPSLTQPNHHAHTL
jgi:hypothetical protein